MTNGVSIIVMWSESGTEALTGDHHFEQAGCVALLISLHRVLAAV